MTQRERVMLMIATMLFILTLNGQSSAPVRDTRPLREKVRKKYLYLLDMPERARKTLANRHLLWAALVNFKYGEGRMPETYSELLHSLYFPVPPEAFINPYTGKPVEIVTKPSLGNFDWDKHTDDPPAIGMCSYIDPSGEGKRIERGQCAYSGMENVERDHVKLFQTIIAPLNEKQKKVFWMCHALTNLIMTSSTYLGYVPTSWEEQKELDWLINWEMWKNVYTRQTLRDVSYWNPSPGDFTYSGFLNEERNSIQEPLFICYDENRKPIHPSHFIRPESKDFAERFIELPDLIIH